MFSVLKYIFIFVAFIGTLFWIDRSGIDIKGSLQKSGDIIVNFFSGIINAPDLNREDIFKGLDKIDLVGGLASTTATSTIKKNEVKSSGVIAEGVLSAAGIIKYTNIERTKRGLKPLTVQNKLSISANSKTDDLFDQQYFEHVSPSGLSVADLAKDAGYEFEIIAENLALGNFGSNQKLVAAWMNSPTHRANILNPKFTEIGVAAANGIYKGDGQWIFVQHFGKPIPKCDKADMTLKTKIDTEKIALETEERELQEIAAAIESNPHREDEYLDQYNTRVASYNNRLSALKELVTLYNKQVGQYNACLAG